MTLTTAQDARIDSRVTGFLLVALLSFALGIFMSLFLVEHPASFAKPCPATCPRLILMNHGAKAAKDAADGTCDMQIQSPFALDAAGGDAIL